MQLGSATELRTKKFFQNSFYKIHTKSVGDFFIIFSVLSTLLLPSKCRTFSQIFLIIMTFSQVYLKSLFRLLMLLVKCLQNFTVIDRFYTLRVVYWWNDAFKNLKWCVCVRRGCHRAKSMEDFSEAGMWRIRLIFLQPDKVLEEGDGRTCWNEATTGWEKREDSQEMQ